ncbi:WD repeat-containing protein 54-like isoform X2 [Adelges cooleyi]|uniref:WD repeat-containing protein 54-like isoform X2 n=1 Tax=Adelges cooleyi TaxID=133065 RepID=UPI002180019C|nr:WD repeat-containing protein 54-like isoform X2 [Adelges cooleyi]
MKIVLFEKNFSYSLNFCFRIYTKEKRISIRGSASAITNNVSVNISEDQNNPFSLAVINQQKIHIVCSESSEADGDYCLDTKTDVTQVHWCTLGYMNCLVLTCSEGLIIYNYNDHFKRVYSHSCEDKTTKEKFAKGIATFDCTYLCVGNSNGSIRVFGPDEQGQIMFIDRKLIHGAPITDMASYKHNLVSCDESGYTVLSKLDCGELVIVARSNGFEGCGKIRVFDPATRIPNVDAEDQLPVCIQVSAHARSVTAMSTAKDADLLISVSEDSWIRVWKINLTVVTLAYCYMREDSMLIGCQFITRNGSKFCTTTYNSPYVTCYALDQ